MTPIVTFRFSYYVVIRDKVKERRIVYRCGRILLLKGSVQPEKESPMNIKRMGRTGLKVSEVCLGTMTFGKQSDEPTAFAILDLAAGAGVNFIDTADVYPVPPSLDLVGRTEEIVGKWIKGKRHQFILATKCGNAMGEKPNDAGLSRKHLLEAVEASLRRLQTDTIDLYYVHRPDPETPIDETLRALEDVVRSGKARYLGCSNFTAWEIAKSLWTSDRLNLTRFDAVQPRYNLLFREIENEVLPLCRDQGLGVIAFNPLAGGFLTGKYQREEEPPDDTRFGLFRASDSLYRVRYWKQYHFDAMEEMKKFFEPRNRQLVHVALAWVLAQPDVTSAILGASRPDQLQQSLAALSVKLDEEEMIFCNKIWFTLPRASDPRYALR
jgi:aryl-alcohol dehydrogenase-like predicted oxidoreductase